MKYEKIIKAKFIERPNRFIAVVEVDGEQQKSHVKNTGRCKELLVPGATVYLEDFEGRMGSRKMRYSLIGVEKVVDDKILMINMDSQAPNKVVKEALLNGKIKLPGMASLDIVKSEYVYGDSRLDFYVKDIDGVEGFIEVKGVTLEDRGIASFPDAPTERGIKHLKELAKARGEGKLVFAVFVIQMKEVHTFIPNDITHKAFGDALREAQAAGVYVLAYDCIVETDTLSIDQPIKVEL
ncbi:MAG: DNA/RNA nuclease SfsA [Firmicutes bacterium]|nr:DNA/RNA nuclease SfsA [Bacillota bacterium]